MGIAGMRQRLIDEMRGIFGDDRRRIDHAMMVLAFAEQIMAEDFSTGGDLGGDAGGVGIDACVVVAAAILHDIGIHAAERTHGSSAGRYQEIEGPPIAREILLKSKLHVDEAAVEHICRIIANHHSARDIDTPEFRIIWDADWLTNIPDQYDTDDKTHMAKLAKLIPKIFRTDPGRRIAESLYVTG